MISELLIQIIHYSPLEDRRKYLEELFFKEELQAKYILDHDRENMETAQNEFTYLKDEGIFLAKINELWKIEGEEYRVLTDGELSCYYKHLQALKNLSLSEKNYGLILEDDVLPLKSIKKNLEKILKKLKNSDWDIIFLGRGSGKEFIKSKSKYDIANLKYLIPEHPASNCAEAYILKKDVAKKLFKQMKKFHLSYDWELGYQMYKADLNVRWYYPSLFRQGSQDSTYNSALR